MDTEEEKREVTSRALTLRVINQGSEAHEMNLVKLAKGKGQGFSNVALIGSKLPTPGESRACGRCGRFGAKAATPATRSFTLFLGGEGKRKKTFEKPWSKGTQVLGFLYDQIRITSETETMSLC